MPAPWILCAVLFLWPQKGYIWTEKGSGKGHKDDQRCGTASQLAITKQNRLEMKWQSGDMTEVHKSQVSRKEQIGNNENSVPSRAGTRGITWNEKVAGSKQGKGSGSAHSMLLSSGVLCLGMLWITAVSESSRIHSQNKHSPQTSAIYRCNFQLMRFLSPELLAGRKAHQASTMQWAISFVLLLPRQPRLSNIRDSTLG